MIDSVHFIKNVEHLVTKKSNEHLLIRDFEKDGGKQEIVQEVMVENIKDVVFEDLIQVFVKVVTNFIHKESYMGVYNLNVHSIQHVDDHMGNNVDISIYVKIYYLILKDHENRKIFLFSHY